MASYLELRQLLHEFLLLFAVGEWRQNIQKDFEQVQTLSRHAGQCEDGGDTVEGGTECADQESSNRKQRLEPYTWKGELLLEWRGAPLCCLLRFSGAWGPLSVSHGVWHVRPIPEPRETEMPGTALRPQGPRRQQSWLGGRVQPLAKTSSYNPNLKNHRTEPELVWS